MLARRCAPCLIALWVGSCGGDHSSVGAGPPPVFPSEYASSYVEVRPCRTSTEHDLDNVKIYADPASASTYTMRDAPFAAGAVILKEEYSIADTNCVGPILLWTAMEKLPANTAPETLDWHWQKVDETRTVVTDNERRCYSCHEGCGVAPNGFDGTCSPP